jgi:dihydropteroate synthase
MQKSKAEQLKELNIKKPVLADDARTVEASYDTWTQWKNDSKGYWLFRLVDGKIEAGFCKETNKISTTITGTDGEAIYNTIIREGLVTSLQHAAYIGYELQKCEIALKKGLKYVQDKQLEF